MLKGIIAPTVRLGTPMRVFVGSHNIVLIIRSSYVLLDAIGSRRTEDEGFLNLAIQHDGSILLLLLCAEIQIGNQ